MEQSYIKTAYAVDRTISAAFKKIEGTLRNLERLSDHLDIKAQPSFELAILSLNACLYRLMDANQKNNSERIWPNDEGKVIDFQSYKSLLDLIKP